MKGIILCYRTLDELKGVHKNIVEGMKPMKWRSIIKLFTLLNENDVPYPYTLVASTGEEYFDAFDNFIVDKKIDIGHPDMYMLFGREHDIFEMIPIELEV